MKSIIVKIWKKAGSLNLTVAVCLLLVVDLGYGYLCIHRHTSLFSPMNDIGILTWINTYGINNLMETAWFFILLILLAMLGINTFVCTTDRMLVLLEVRKSMVAKRFVVSLAPHIMHYAVIVILLGYLLSYLFSDVLPTKTLLPGMTATLPASPATMTFKELKCDYYSGSRMPFFQDFVITPKAHLVLSDGKTQSSIELTLNRPLFLDGYTVFLKDFSPRKKGGMKQASDRIDLSIRKDPGVVLYLTGMFMFFIGLLLYIYGLFYFNRLKKESI